MRTGIAYVGVTRSVHGTLKAVSEELPGAGPMEDPQPTPWDAPTTAHWAGKCSEANPAWGQDGWDGRGLKHPAAPSSQRDCEEHSVGPRRLGAYNLGRDGVLPRHLRPGHVHPEEQPPAVLKTPTGGGQSHAVGQRPLGIPTQSSVTKACYVNHCAATSNPET